MSDIDKRHEQLVHISSVIYANTSYMSVEESVDKAEQILILCQRVKESWVKDEVKHQEPKS